jgi:hypothetical protein
MAFCNDAGTPSDNNLGIKAYRNGAVNNIDRHNHSTPQGGCSHSRSRILGDRC